MMRKKRGTWKRRAKTFEASHLNEKEQRRDLFTLLLLIVVG